MIDKRQILPKDTLLHSNTYKVIRCLGAGGFGITYEVEHVQLGERMCMKEFFMDTINLREERIVTVSVEKNLATFEKMREKFNREAQRVRKLHEKHIVEVTDLFMENGTSYFVMQLIDGESLDARLHRTGLPLNESEARDVLMQVLSALKCVHQNHLQHLDIKPANIMADANGHIWLIDFGASKQLSTDEGRDMTVSSTLCYTVRYAPSEQVEQNLDRLGPWTDFYALGATLYNLQTCRKPPLPSEVNDEGEQAFTFPTSMSTGMRNLILWFMQPRRNNRPQCVEEIEQHLASEQEKSIEQRTLLSTFDDKNNNRPQCVEKIEQRLTSQQEESIEQQTSLSTDDNSTRLNNQTKTKVNNETEIAQHLPKRNHKWLVLVLTGVFVAIILGLLTISKDDRLKATPEQKDSIRNALYEQRIEYAKAAILAPVAPEAPAEELDEAGKAAYAEVQAAYDAAVAEYNKAIADVTVDSTTEAFKAEVAEAVKAFEEALNKPAEEQK